VGADDVTLEQYGAVLAGLGEGIELGLLLLDQGIEPDAWARAEEAWPERLDDENDVDLQPLMDAALVAGRKRYGRRIEPLDDDIRAWLCLVRHFAAAPEPLAALADMGMRPNDMLRLHAWWSERCRLEPQLLVRARDALTAELEPLPALTFFPGWQPSADLMARWEAQRDAQEEAEDDEDTQPEIEAARPPLFASPAPVVEPVSAPAQAAPAQEPPAVAATPMPPPAAAHDPLRRTAVFSIWGAKNKEALPFRPPAAHDAGGGAAAGSSAPPPSEARATSEVLAGGTLDTSTPRAGAVLPFERAPRPADPDKLSRTMDSSPADVVTAEVAPRAASTSALPPGFGVSPAPSRPAGPNPALPFKPSASTPAPPDTLSLDPSPSEPPPKKRSGTLPLATISLDGAEPRPEVSHLNVEAYAALEVTLAGSADPAEALRALGMDQASLERERTLWSERLTRDPALRGRYHQALLSLRAGGEGRR
jgi:hypothetical protein